MRTASAVAAIVGALCLRLAAAGPIEQISFGLDAQAVNAYRKKPAHVHVPHQVSGHLSQWAHNAKSDFLTALKDGSDISEYVFVMGTQAADTDSVVSAVTYAYSLRHREDDPWRAVPLMQYPRDRIVLRPENRLALDHGHMANDHEDLLTLDDLPKNLSRLGERLKGVVLVDHNLLIPSWGLNTTVLSILDHHHDHGAMHLAASPRIVNLEAKSCSSIVAMEVLNHEHRHKHGHLPRAVPALLLSAIAIDTKGLKKARAIDKRAASSLVPLSYWKGRKVKPLMKAIGKEMKKAEADLGHLSLYDLFRRDWKAATDNGAEDVLHIGFANIPLTLAQQFKRIGNLSAWLEVEQTFAHVHGADLTLTLTKAKVKRTSLWTLKSKKIKVRELVLTVSDTLRLKTNEADSAFEFVRSYLEHADGLSLRPWTGPGADTLSGRRAIWTQDGSDVGRKVVRPIVEEAVKAWAAEWRRQDGDV